MRPIRKPVGAKVTGQLVEEGVARVRKALGDVERTEATAVPVPVLVRADREVRRGLQLRISRDDAVHQGT